MKSESVFKTFLIIVCLLIVSAISNIVPVSASGYPPPATATTVPTYTPTPKPTTTATATATPWNMGEKTPTKWSTPIPVPTPDPGTGNTNDDLRTMISTVLAGVITVLAGMIGAWLRSQIKQASLSLTAKQLELLKIIATNFVTAAEQIGKENDWTNPSKKEWVIAQAQALLDKYHIPIDASVLESAIESAVSTELKHGVE